MLSTLPLIGMVALQTLGLVNPAPKPFAPPSANIALGKPYTLKPAPDYSYCTDPGDATQLTDGVYTKGYFWTQKSTVGWRNAKPVVIVIDLGAIKPIRGVSVNTAAGVAGVAWPTAIDVLVADKPNQFHVVGDLLALSSAHGIPKPDVYAVHRYWTDALHTHGRYVALLISAVPFFFTDEVEVYAGAPQWLQQPLPGKPITDLATEFVDTQIKAAIRRRVREDAINLKEKINESKLSDAQKQTLAAKLDKVVTETAAAKLEVSDDFRAVLPLNPLHQRVFDVQAEAWRDMGLKPLTLWQSGLWDALSLLADPDTAKPATIDLAMMRNEYRAGSINLSNATDHALTVSLRFDGLPGAPAPDYIRVCEVPWTDTSAGIPVAAALPDAQRNGAAWAIHIPAGITRQVWFTFHPTATPPGKYQGHVIVAAAGASEQAPVALHIYPFRFPDHPTLHLGGWDYTDQEARYNVTKQNRKAFIALLRKHFVDSPWGTSAVLSFGKYNATGTMTTKPNTADCDTWLARWSGAAQYLVFASVGKTLDALQPGSAPFDKAVGEWATFWAKHIRQKGLRPEQFSVLLIDEPHDAARQALIASWAKAIRAAKSGIRVWEDPTFHKASEADTAMLRSCNVVCPNRVIFLDAAPAYRDLFATLRKEGVELAFYSCSGPARLLDPYSYYRLQAWDCRRYGAASMYFWAFGDGGGVSSWNEYALPRNAYTPLFLDATSCVTAKELEACREGVEDYEYFVMLQKAVEQARKTQGNTGVVKRAESLLHKLPIQVTEAGRLPSFKWSAPLDRTVADTACRKILDAMVALNAAR